MASNCAITTGSFQPIYQADWPTELIEKFYKDANYVQSVALYNLLNYAKPFQSNYWSNNNALDSRLIKQAWGYLRASRLVIRLPGYNPFAESTRQNILAFYRGSETISVKTPDGICLKGFLVAGRASPNKAILFCNPNESSMETMAQQYLQIADAAGATAVIFNQRSIEQSEGESTPDGFILDGYTMFEYLVNQRGISPNDIVIYGRSMGGGWGAEVAAMAQRKYPRTGINFVSERSFSCLTYECRAFASTYTKGIFGFLGSSAFVDAYMYATGIHVFHARPCAEFLKGRVCIIFDKTDDMIPYYSSSLGLVRGASLNEVFHLANSSCKEILRIELKNPNPKDSSHDRTFNDPELRAVAITLRRMLNIPEEFDFPTPDYVKQMIRRESRYWA